MYKIIAIGKNGVRVDLSESGEEIIFDSYEEANNFLTQKVDREMLPDNYEWSIVEL